MRVSQVDGAGAVRFDESGRVSMVVQDDLADIFDEAERRGMSADDVINGMLNVAEAKQRADREERCTCGREVDACRSVPTTRTRRRAPRLMS